MARYRTEGRQLQNSRDDDGDRIGARDPRRLTARQQHNRDLGDADCVDAAPRRSETVMHGAPSVVEEPFVHKPRQRAVGATRGGSECGQQKECGRRRHERQEHVTQPCRGRQLKRQARKRGPAPDTLIAHDQGEQKRKARRDDETVEADQPGDPLQVSDSWLLQIQGSLVQRLDTAECRQHEAQRRGQRQRPDPRHLQRDERPRRNKDRERRGQHEDEQYHHHSAHRLRHRAFGGRPPLTLKPPDDPDRGQRERHGPAVASQTWHRHAGDAPAERDHVVAGHDRGQRAEHQAIGKERRDGNGRRPLTERFAHAAVQAAAHEEGAGLEVSRAHDDAQQYDGQHGPRTDGAEPGRGDSADEERRAAEFRKRARRRPPDRHVQTQRPRGEDDTDTFRCLESGDDGPLVPSIVCADGPLLPVCRQRCRR